ncbi:CRISPR system precrRNA processing endoribonuclease RAMP protein Cas6 [Caryophanon latum]|uniref:CRISPR-associated protein Cas6 C-terminal domain-containing protein n=1 Tax=Caryophanon latum TaxID=33977 RepID=A0A1C0YV46_9BACL|nr:CRISPR system precrRNA processing endoribonuclease RAMP protein Cas6 [Caryophanon latum]OCS91021.1 hypothetical protein A6K76_09760 [Caryophanon latum]
MQRPIHNEIPLSEIPLTYIRLHFSIRAVDSMQLGKYPAMTIRGGLGYAMQQLACECRSKQHDADCLYAKMYEEKQGETVEDTYIPYVRPFVIHTGVNELHTYTKHMTYQFSITLFGQATKAYDLFILAMQHFGEAGIGEKKSPFTVVEVKAEQHHMSQLVFHQNRLLRIPAPQRIADQPLLPADVYVRFTTPLRLQVQGKNQHVVTLPELFQNIVRRLRSLLYFHCEGYYLPSSVEEVLLRYAERATIEEADFYYVQYKRFSTRQKNMQRIDGTEGSFYAYDLHEVLVQLLLIGQVMHVGKQTVFGLGRYEVSVF